MGFGMFTCVETVFRLPRFSVAFRLQAAVVSTKADGALENSWDSPLYDLTDGCDRLTSPHSRGSLGRLEG
ncbi:hypothetical protein F11_01730 [Rhodospirillum rubrum F11]|nr:hypothetical protein F11_01730 [Rhodospirillum rubrum F11]MBK5952694.1 hypothetical protein [Rhodospirillum rubrum]HAP98564.1 hypothetical protein [Rhodospirillum rubrum]HCF17951.1 hypothetical protein [Rhodospirillum rubrum]